VRGGRRIGSGRKRRRNRKRVSVTFDVKTLERVREAALMEANEKTIGPWLERAAISYLERNDNERE
jgi:hypothetical protein